jgi:hypothetical protein
MAILTRDILKRNNSKVINSKDLLNSEEFFKNYESTIKVFNPS